MLLIAAVGVGFIALSAPGRKPPSAVASARPIVLDLPAMKVNLAGEQGPRALHLALTLEATDAAGAQAVQAALPYLFDAFQTHIRELRAAELEGAAGIFRLREALMRRANLAIAPQKVRAVLVREMLVK
jgi:flagellar FliL protein